MYDNMHNLGKLKPDLGKWNFGSLIWLDEMPCIYVTERMDTLKNLGIY